MKNYYQDGFNVGYGESYLNNGHDYPTSDGDRCSYNEGIENGIRRREISNELEEDY